MDPLDLVAWLRQRAFPEAFRFDGALALDAIAKVVAASARAPVTTAASSSPPPSPPSQSPPAVDTVDTEFLVALANEQFRLMRSTEGLLSKHGEGREARKVGRAVEALTGVLDRYGLEVLNLEGQEYDPGRLDFTPIAEPEPTPGLTSMKIVLCERPLVRHGGKIVQVAKGIVGRPA